MRKLIPKFLRNLDKRMMYRSPQLWITKIHYAIPAVLLIAGILFGLTVAYGYNLENDIPEQWNSFSLLILPTIAIFFYWFVIQAQYNVDKNYGRLSLGHDYQNFFSYLVIVSSFFLVMISIPTGQLTSVENAISDQELIDDINTLNTGYAYFQSDFEVKTYASDRPGEYRPAKLMVGNTQFVNTTYYDDAFEHGLDAVMEEVVDDYDYDYQEKQQYVREVTYAQAMEEISNLILVYNKYTADDISPNIDKILKKEIYFEHRYNYSDYEEHIVDEKKNNYSYVHLDWEVSNKLDNLWDIKFGNYYMSIFNYEFMMVMFAIIGYLVLLTWMFKNVHWKNYVAAAIVAVLTPMIIAITALILYQVIKISSGNEEEIILTILICCNVLLLVFGVIPVMRKKYSSFGVVCMILLQFFMPFLIAVYGQLILEMMRHYSYEYSYGHDYNWEYYHEIRMWMSQILYYGSWLFMIASLPLFKKYYAYMWAFPKGK
ncbi:MAG: hypothetical protein JKY54_03340 [Flavobacteriales bacterium]|nr:hypothetical protein [Flavobacteriales bacterium]